MDEEKILKNTGTVIVVNKQNWTYTVKLDSGESRKRNRIYLLPIREQEYVFQERRNEKKKQNKIHLKMRIKI